MCQSGIELCQPNLDHGFIHNFQTFTNPWYGTHKPSQNVTRKEMDIILECKM